MLHVRKTAIIRESVNSEMAKAGSHPIIRIAGLVVIENPFAGRYVDDLSELFAAGKAAGELLMPDVVRQLSQSPIAYGKAAIVGANGEFEHGGACIHPMLGKPMRSAVGGGKNVIPSNVKVGVCGVSIDVPLAHKDDAWSFDHFDTMTVAIADAPRPNEIVIIMAVADGGRVHPRCGSGPR